MTDPALSAQTAESDLRELARLVLEPMFGPDWFEKCGLNTKVIEAAKASRERQERDRPGVSVEQGLIFYIDLSDLVGLINHNWTRFEAVLGPNKRYWNHDADRLRILRNVGAHGRTALPFERDLLSGIAGDIRNRVTKYRSTMNDQNEWWPRIERLSDSFGTVMPERTGPISPTKRSGVVLAVGDVVTFDCAGWDPQGRALRWEARRGVEVLASAEGSNTQLSITVTPALIGSSVWIEVALINDAPYHRDVTSDDAGAFNYTVRPPGV
ncbi:hypothetical protein [Amnibacterium kyonggiense]|uniref:Swt1-like HEPN domain-containing protein n=1 Tax=Amnibacterium kyonggiense TaxID=595671 RepID=A0A4R7FII5_9MICO|nr:hypothetical protein [Amnibacterium kyonggiense]TDS74510.1 hypothetical protein CLV52_3693 [Amnibacterium kyonggiense]